MDMSGMTIKLESSDIMYLQKDIWTNYQDVFIKSIQGKVYGFNRLMLASLSWLCKELFLQINECPLANLDESIHISSDFSDSELEALREFFLSGEPPPKPESPEGGDSLELLFKAMGLDLNNIMASFKDSTAFKYDGDTNKSNWKCIFGNWSHLVLDERSREKVEDKWSSSFIKEVKMEIDGGSDGEYYPDPEDIVEPHFLEEEEKPLKKSRGRKPKESLDAKTSKKTPKKVSTKRSLGISLPITAKLKYEKDPKKKEYYFYFPQEISRDLSKPYQCERCSRSFKDAQEYRWHCHRHDLPTDDYSRAFLCDKCEAFECSSPKELATHRKVDCQVNKRNDAGSKFTYFCAVCVPGVRFDGYKDLLSHHRELHSDIVSCGEEVFCPTCGVNFVAFHVLKKHYIKEGPYHENAKCAFCPNITFTSWKEHKEHLDKFHNGVLKYPCGFCGINYFSTRNEVSNHKTICKVSPSTQPVIQYPDGKHITCTICLEKVAANPVDVRMHLKDAHSALGEPCTICKDIFFSKKHLEEHTRTMHLKKLHCDKCDKVFSTSAKLRDHQISHEEERAYVCGECGKAFHRISNLRKHEKFAHQGHRCRAETSNKIITCEKCGTEIRECRYRYHKKRCHSQESYPCTECNISFPHMQFLKAHISDKHTILTCDYCGKQIKKYAMKKHILVNHTADSAKPHVCNVCQKGFAVKDRLHEHMNIHTGSRPFTCRFCTKTFANKANCSKHMRESHAEDYKLYKESKITA